MSSDSLETWVANVEANENATMLRDTTVDIAKFDEFGHVLDVDVSTVGVDLTFSITRTVKNDTNRWILGQLQFQMAKINNEENSIPAVRLRSRGR